MALQEPVSSTSAPPHPVAVIFPTMSMDQIQNLTLVQLAAMAVDPVALAHRRADVRTIRKSAPELERTATEPVALSAKAFGVGRVVAYTMQRIQRTAPDVYEAARRGEIATVSEAARLAGVPYDRRVRPRTINNPGASTDRATQRGSRHDVCDESVLALHNGESLGTTEIAKRLGVSRSFVQGAKSRLGIARTADTNPLRGLTDFATEAADTIEIAISNPSQRANATPEQTEELVTQLRELRRMTSTLVKMLSSKE